MAKEGIVRNTESKGRDLMIFSSYSFIFIFLPITFFVYRILNVLRLYSVSKLWLVLVSIYFYAQGSPNFVFIFVVVLFFNFIIGSTMLNADSLLNKRCLLALGLAQNILLLGYYKYTGFLLENYNMISGQSLTFSSIMLPLGISFFTFQLIAYLVDCYRGHIEVHSVIDYLIFITFFPQLIVGPIVHHKDIIPQFDNEKQQLFNKDNFMLGLFLFSIGCAKKIALADPLTAYAENYLKNIAGADVLTSWLAVTSYTFSYYFDLSGYADMAIGLGWLFNIKLPQNFNSPYKARNFREYWQKWHITLSRFLGDYIFRSIFKKGDGSIKFYYAIMVTFLISGIWHGAGWHFVIWGLINGIFVCAAHFMTRRQLRLPFLLAWMLTFAGVIGTRILFISSNTSQALQIIRKMFDFTEFEGLDIYAITKNVLSFFAFNSYTTAVLCLAIGITLFAKNSSQITEEFQPNVKTACWAASLLVFALFHMTEVSKFLYFQF